MYFTKLQTKSNLVEVLPSVMRANTYLITEFKENTRNMKKITSILLITCIITALTGCNYLPWSEEYRQKKVWPKESAEYLASRYPNDTFTYKDYYETLPLTTTVYRYESANYPGFDIEVSFHPDVYSGNAVDTYGICMQGYYRMYGPVCNTLDEFLDRTRPTLILLVYADPSKEYEEDYKNIVGHEILNTGHDFEIMLYIEEDATNPSGMTRDEILDYVDHLPAYSGYLCEIHHLD